VTNPVLTRRNFCSFEGSSRKEGFFPPSDWQSMVRRDKGQLYCWSPFTSVPSGTGCIILSVTHEEVTGGEDPPRCQKKLDSGTKIVESCHLDDTNPQRAPHDPLPPSLYSRLSLEYG
jgi:hypothetical protein